ncbi:unnamed protein product [Nesidiocoris tenuis]|uniref:Complexin n=1 Tax=Nesidiocoris tenuis TaxID=355587 RepID=A0A6H5HIB1_9HEMI|nr:unnamed protein product [Nesidiocoris tenuis]
MNTPLSGPSTRHCVRAVGGDNDGDEGDKEKEEEAERERQEAIREAEERRKEKHRKMEEEREKMRQEIRDKVFSNRIIFFLMLRFRFIFLEKSTFVIGLSPQAKNEPLCRIIRVPWIQREIMTPRIDELRAQC